MFNWVCPRCGKDVPPSKTECPYCVNQPQQGPPQAGVPPQIPPQQTYPPQAYPQQAYPPPPTPQAYPPPPPAYTAPAPAWQPPPPPAPAPPQAWQPPQQWAPPVPQAPPPPPPPQNYAPPATPAYTPPPAAYPPADYAAAPQPQTPWPPQKQGPPAWLVGGGVAVALLVVLGLAYYSMQPSSGKSDAPADKSGSDKVAATTAPAEKGSNPLQKSVEIVGIRLVTQDKKPVAKLVVVNHSLAEITGLEANVTLYASTKRSEEDAVGTFQIKVSSVAPNGSTEVSAPLTTKLKPYELPDWQNLTADLQITSPKP